MADAQVDYTTAEKVKEILEIIESGCESNVLKAEVIQRLISKIYIRSRYVKEGSRERGIDITIVYRAYNEIIKGFLTNDE